MGTITAPATTPTGEEKVFGYMPDDVPPPGAMLSLGFQQILTIPVIVFLAIVGILMNLLFLTVKPEWFGVKEREQIGR